MNLSDLTLDEKTAFVALIERVAMGDRDISDTDQAAIDDVVAELGEDNYRLLMERVDELFKSNDDLKAFLKQIQRPEARELIYGTLLQEIIGDTTDHEESTFLEWLAKAWNVPVDYSGGPQSGTP